MAQRNTIRAPSHARYGALTMSRKTYREMLSEGNPESVRMRMEEDK